MIVIRREEPLASATRRPEQASRLRVSQLLFRRTAQQMARRLVGGHMRSLLSVLPSPPPGGRSVEMSLYHQIAAWNFPVGCTRWVRKRKLPRLRK